jgi:hypothetical protein
MNAAHIHADEPLITYTLFPDVTPREKTERVDVPWHELVERIEKAPTYLRKSDCPLISIAEYGDLKSDKDCLRHAANVKRIFGVEIDYDGEMMPMEEAANILHGAGILSCLYTSPSHRRDKPRWRVLLPLSEPAAPSQRAEFVGRVNRLLGGVATRESFTLSQSFYLGRVKDAEYVVIGTDGVCIDLAADLIPQYYAGHGNNGDSPRDPTTDEQLRARFKDGTGRYEAMLSLSARWAARGMSAEDIEVALLDLLATGNTSNNADGIDLRTRARPMALSAFRKFGETRSPRQYVPRETMEREPGCDDEPPQQSPEEVPPEPGHERRRIKWAELEGKSPPERTWIINHWLTYGPTLLAGQGGIGKTLLAQMMGTAIALGRPYVDEIAAPANVLFWACEDDHDELWRRQIAICKHFEIPLGALEGKLIIEPRLGMDNSLLLPTFGAPTWTPLRQEMRQQVNDYKASVLIVDNIGQCFGGNENDRHHVTAFLSGLVGLSETPLAVLMLGHPSKSLNSEYSGSTAWEAAVRMRWYLGTRLPDKKPEEGEEADTKVRFLCKRKANYSQLDYRQLTFQDGAYQCNTPPSGYTFREKYGSSARKDSADALVLAAVDQFFRANVRTTEGANSPDYIVKKMQEIRICQDYSQKELNEALTRLRLSGRVVTAPVGQYGNRSQKFGLAPLGSI